MGYATIAFENETTQLPTNTGPFYFTRPPTPLVLVISIYAPNTYVVWAPLQMVISDQLNDNLVEPTVLSF